MNAFPDFTDPQRAFHRAAEDYIASLRDTYAVSYAEAMSDIGKLRSIGSTVREAIGWIDAFAKGTHGKTKSPSPREVAELVVEMICGAYGMEEAIPVVMAAYDLGEPARKPESESKTVPVALNRETGNWDVIPVLQPITAQVATFDPPAGQR